MSSEASFFLPFGSSVTITCGSAAGGGAYVNNTTGANQVPIAASSSVTLGPYDSNYNFTILGLPVLPTYTIQQAVVATISNNQQFPAVALLAASGAITQWYGINVITKSSGVAALTLAAPTAAQEGQKFIVTSRTAEAHTITATSLFNNGTTGGPHTTATFAAYPGASIELVADNLLWNVVSSNNVTIS